MREIDKKEGREERMEGERGGNRMREKREKEGRHLFHITAFNLTQGVKLADNTDSFTKVSHEESYTTDTHTDFHLP